MLFPFAHEADFPHSDPPPPPDDDPSTLPILAAIVFTLVVLAALIWLRERTRRADEREREAREAAARADAEPGAPSGS